MNQTLLKRVRELRTQDPYRPATMTTAVSIARYEASADTAEPAFLRGLTDYPFDDKVEGEHEGFTVKVQIVTDEDSMLGDDDVTGTFTDTWVPGETIRVRSGENWGTNGNGYKYYRLSTYELTELPKDLADDHTGMSKGTRQLAYQWAIRQAEEADRNRDYYGVIVEVFVDDEEVGSHSLWGVDVVPGYNPRPYMIEVATDLMDEAISEAHGVLNERAEKAEAHARRMRQLFAEAIDV